MFNIAKKAIRRLGARIAASSPEETKACAAQTAISLVALRLAYKAQIHGGLAGPSLRDVGFRIFSQHDEDGIIHFIFSVIGEKSRVSVELCSGNGIECNTANLVINHRWSALMVDGSDENCRAARKFYENHPDSMFWPPTIKQAWLTRSNINEVLREAGFEGEIDLLSFDTDGMDYWLLREIDCIVPRVIVLEFNHLWGAEEAVSIPYSDKFVAEFTQYGADYSGASLAAFVILLRSKGYRLIGSNTIGTNAFFVRNDIEHHWLPEVHPKELFSHPRSKFGMKHRFPLIKDRPWVSIY